MVSNVDRVLAGPGPGLSETTAAVRNRVVVLVDRRGKLERGFERRLVERREHASGIRGLELTDGVAAIVRLAQIETAQLIVQDARVLQLNLRLSGRNLAGYGEGRLLARGIERYLRRLTGTTRDDRHRVERDLRGVQGDGLCRPFEPDADALGAGERCRRQARFEGDVVVTRGDVAGQPLCERRRRRREHGHRIQQEADEELW